MEVATFAEIEGEFIERVYRMVWCNLATVDVHGRPRSRIIHPIWEGNAGWVGTRPTSHKAKHLSINPFVSLAYIADIAKPVYVDCDAEWVEDVAVKQYVWELFKNAPAPMGYDPGTIWQSYHHEGFGVLKFTPWRIEVNEFPTNTRVWHAPKEA